MLYIGTPGYDTEPGFERIAAGFEEVQSTYAPRVSLSLLSQLQPFRAVQRCVSAGMQHILGQPSALLARSASPSAGST